jgi:hypothetical protein
VKLLAISVLSAALAALAALAAGVTVELTGVLTTVLMTIPQFPQT